VDEKLKASIKGMLPTGLTLSQFLTEFLVEHHEGTDSENKGGVWCVVCGVVCGMWCVVQL
jgi:hypothetical protein